VNFKLFSKQKNRPYLLKSSSISPYKVF